MSRNQTLRNWGAVIVVLVVTGMLTAVWPSLTGGADRQTVRPEVEAETIVFIIPSFPAELVPIPLPDAVVNLGGLAGRPIPKSSTVWLVILASATIVAVGAVAVPLALIYRFLAIRTEAVMTSEEYAAKLAALENKEKERLARLREGRVVHSVPDHKMPRWSAISTSLIILMFVLFFGTMINRTFFPESQLIRDGDVINTAGPIVGGLVLLTLLFLAFRLRPGQLEAAEAVDGRGIPWDFIAVLLTGLLVVGLGIGIIVYLNVPA